ncbi:recombinase RecT [Natroniella sp. ANB-PHB2]|uniref:recombinase RecT n=1 Tax=Natroniella sp. ANB-PHB2 TaxID=3384444 RepID=UPI0038D49D6F
MSNNQLAMVKKDTVDVVAERVREFKESGEIDLPANYSVENAMKSAWLELQSTKTKNKKPVLEACTNDSIANALLDMAVQGLTPAKDQCYFVAYGNKLVLMRSYFGSMTVVKQVAGAEDVRAQPVFKGDDFEYEVKRGTITNVEHKQTLKGKLSGNILAVYCVITFKDDRPDYIELMTMDQIENAWSQGQTYRKGSNGTHQKFEEEMAKKTVINRACKKYINSSNDSNILAESFNRAGQAKAEQEVKQEIEENANSEVIDVSPEAEEEKEQIEEDKQVEQENPEPAFVDTAKTMNMEQTGTEGPAF